MLPNRSKVTLSKHFEMIPQSERQGKVRNDRYVGTL